MFTQNLKCEFIWNKPLHWCNSSRISKWNHVGFCVGLWASLRAQWQKKNPPANAGDLSLIPVSGRSPGEGNATYSSILAWEIPWTEEPGGLHSMGSQRVEQDWMTKQQWVNDWCPYKKKREFRETQIRGWCEEWGDWSDTSTSKETPSNVRSCRSPEEARKDSHLEASKGVWSSWWLDFRHLASRTGEETGNPLQYSCLENPMDRGAW